MSVSINQRNHNSSSCKVIISDSMMCLGFHMTLRKLSHLFSFHNAYQGRHNLTDYEIALVGFLPKDFIIKWRSHSHNYKTPVYKCIADTR